MNKYKRNNPRKRHQNPDIKDDKKEQIEEAKGEMIEDMEIDEVKKADDKSRKEDIKDLETVVIEDDVEVSKKEDKELHFGDAECKQIRKNNKTLIAIIIVLAGIAIGSFFVDIAQLFTQRGFSARAVEDAQVVEYNGNTWVRYDDPKIVVDVFDANDCEDCVTDEVLVRLRSLIPTLEAHRIDVRTDEGKQYASDNDIKHIPAFLFSDNVIDSDFYQGAAILFKDAPDNKYYFEASNVGVPIGEYLEEPSTDVGVLLGNDDAKVSVVVFTDFTCDMCKTVDPIINKIREDFKDDVRVVVKVTPDTEQKNAVKIAAAAQCANAQNIFDKYTAKLFLNQKALLDADSVNEVLSKYAGELQMDVDKFTECLADSKISQSLDANATEASRFGIVGTPTLFINGQPHVGVITYDALKEKIESEIIPQNIEK